MKRPLFVLLGIGGLLAGLLIGALPSPAADHLEAPGVQGDGRTDINDLYAFQSPTNSANTVLIMTVNPVAGVMSPTTFDPDASYVFQIDNTGDAVENTSITVEFGPVVGPTQSVTVSGAAGTGAGVTGTEFLTTSSAQVQAGVFDDPFFFDLNGFTNGFAFTGDDFFAGLNVTAIVIEVPSVALNGASSNIGIWAETSTGSIIDRMGRPAISTVLVPDNRKDEFNNTPPSGQFAAFSADVNAAIAALSSQANADALTPILLPDILTVDTASAAGFLNGRQLADDVIDAELGLLSEGAVTADMVDANDLAFPGTFPYLAAPQNLAMCQGMVVTADLNTGGMATEGDDVILGTSGPDTIDGLGGDDVICAEEGDDIVNGGDGDDRILGGTGNDTLDGDDGNDYLKGEQGDDIIYGGFGVDTLVGASGMDELWGEGGSDRLFGGTDDDMLEGGSGADRMWGGPGDDVMLGMGGQDTMWGEQGNDDMQGNWNSDVMNGGPGDDFVKGAAGKDIVNGDDGNDTLFGGNNSDTLNGGTGDDALNGQAGRDTCDGGVGTNTQANC